MREQYKHDDAARREQQDREDRLRFVADKQPAYARLLRLAREFDREVEVFHAAAKAAARLDGSDDGKLSEEERIALGNAKDRKRSAGQRVGASLRDLNDAYGMVLLLASINVREAADSLFLSARWVYDVLHADLDDGDEWPMLRQAIETFGNAARVDVGLPELPPSEYEIDWTGKYF
jgi:hypothetical protein